MDNSNTMSPIIPPMGSGPDLQKHRSPHYGKFLFKGHVKRLNMVCHHCHKLISSDEKDLLNSGEQPG